MENRRFLCGVVLWCAISCSGCVPRTEQAADLNYLTEFYRARASGDVAELRSRLTELPGASVEVGLNVVLALDQALGRPATWRVEGFAYDMSAKSPTRSRLSVRVHSTSGSEYVEQFALQADDADVMRLREYHVTGFPDSLQAQFELLSRASDG